MIRLLIFTANVTAKMIKFSSAHHLHSGIAEWHKIIRRSFIPDSSELHAELK